MTKTNLKDLLLSVEQARVEHHPDLDPSFLQRVVEIEEEAGDDEKAALAHIKEALERLIAAMPEEDPNA